MSDWKCLRFFHDAFENGIESRDARDKGVAKRSLLILGALNRICNGRTGIERSTFDEGGPWVCLTKRTDLFVQRVISASLQSKGLETL